MENIDTKPVGQIVAEDYPTWQVFENYGIDYYNKGKRSLREVADEYKTDLQALKTEIEKSKALSSGENEDFNSWELDTLSDYIVKTFHRYADKQIQAIKPTLEKACEEPGSHSAISEIKKLFDEAAGIIAVHQKKEELILFPFIRKMADAEKNDKVFVKPPATRSVENPVDMLTHEHYRQSDLFQKIAELSQGYTVPQGVDGAFKDSVSLLKEFEIHLHKHLHLENNILFPKALRLEKKLTAGVQ